jgi:hypothetical protein
LARTLVPGTASDDAAAFEAAIGPVAAFARFPLRVMDPEDPCA